MYRKALLHRKALFHGVLVVFVVLNMLSCATRQTEELPEAFILKPFVPYRPATDMSGYKITNMENSTRGLPDWLGAYLETGARGDTRGIEALPRYNGLKCFVLEIESRVLDTLLRRRAVFNAARDFPQMACFRIFSMMTEGAGKSPDILYGSAFLKLMRLASEKKWTQTAGETSYWIYTEVIPHSGNSGSPDGDPAGIYRLYFLVTMPKTVFQNQTGEILNAIKFEKTDSPEQISAFRNACAALLQ